MASKQIRKSVRAHQSIGTQWPASPRPTSDTNSGGEGAHAATDAQLGNSPLVAGPHFRSRRALSPNGTHVRFSPSAAENTFTDEGAQCINAPQCQVSPLIGEIIQLVRMRRRWLRARNSLILQSKAFCRMWTAGDKDQANELYKQIAKDPSSVDSPIAMALMPFLPAIERFNEELKPIEKRLQVLAGELPVYPWVANVAGFGKLNLAMLAGEAGDIGSYRNPSSLWKRFGLGVMDGLRQRRTTDKELAIAMGYSPARRSTAYLLGDCIIKGNKTGEYRALYLARKEIEASRTKTKKHAHDRAARYMTKGDVTLGDPSRKGYANA